MTLLKTITLKKYKYCIFHYSTINFVYGNNFWGVKGIKYSIFSKTYNIIVQSGIIPIKELEGYSF